ncbi:MAG: alkylation response protein AidB-like acyl-CoA dehydrogenase [Candidatus Azotimanducaceae bacterium]|jgi:alkylation response protein AidB-like acyl-CoA dehydrogenase
MTEYIAPTKDMNFVLNEIVGLDSLSRQPGFEECSSELVETVLDEAAKFASGVLSPLNTVGDLIGSKIVDGQVRETSGFSEAYQQFVDGGWNSLASTPEYGGTGLPECVGLATTEMWSAANTSFGLCPLLSQGAIEAVFSHANQELRDTYLAKLISGEWTGTMNLTESQAGSDLAAIRTKAERDGDHYLIKGTKIFITWGDHQMAENIIHLVLARTSDAPEGVHGISLFIVPKKMVTASGEIAQRNNVRAISVEHKMGIHGSPTCVMEFGSDEAGAMGYLVGEENRGLSYMFTMMNHARLCVGVQGVALSDRAYQKAVAYASGRVQGTPVNAPVNEGNAAPIIHHPDVRRMLMLMRSLAEASRALCYLTAVNFDIGHHAIDESEASLAIRRGELLTPVAKAWSTEVSQEVTSLGVQVHGGMGFIEETGAAQFMRDARITTIYEGTTGIQANDLVGRKFLRDGGTEMFRLLAEMRQDLALITGVSGFESMAQDLDTAINRLDTTSHWLLEHAQDGLLTGGVAFNFLMGAGTVVAGWLMAKSAMVASQKLLEDKEFYEAKIITVRFYFAQVLPRAAAYLDIVKNHDAAQYSLSETQW